MPKGFRLTAQQYSECWRDRIQKEQMALADTVEDERKKRAAIAERLEATQRQAEAAAAAQKAQAAEQPIADDLSSVMTTSTNAHLSKIDRLEKKLLQEKQKREELERALERAKQTPMIA